MQPLILPLYAGKTAHDLLVALLGDTTITNLELVQSFWRSQHSGSDFASFWRVALAEGVIPDTAVPPVAVSPQPWRAQVQQSMSASLTLIFMPDPTIWDGRYSNNGWRSWPNRY